MELKQQDVEVIGNSVMHLLRNETEKIKRRLTTAERNTLFGQVFKTVCDGLKIPWDSRSELKRAVGRALALRSRKRGSASRKCSTEGRKLPSKGTAGTTLPKIEEVASVASIQPTVQLPLPLLSGCTADAYRRRRERHA